MKVKDKVFVVTGGAGGIGRELVFNLVQKGAKVAAVDINEKALEETARLADRAGERVSVHVVDITDKKAVDKLPEQVLEKHGHVDGIINNAGIVQPFVDFCETDEDVIRKVMDVNFYGTLYMTKAFLPYLKKRPQAHITNISSMGGFLPVPGQLIYGASKAAVRILTEGLYCELESTNVRVTVVFPGGVASDIMKHSGLEVSEKMLRLQKVIKLTTPSKAAKAAIRATERNRYRKAIGLDAQALDIISRMSPNWGERMIYKAMKSQLYD